MVEDAPKEKRFKLATKPELRERPKEVRNAIETIKHEIADTIEIKFAVLFGSLTKNKKGYKKGEIEPDKNSDIDGIVFAEPLEEGIVDSITKTGIVAATRFSPQSEHGIGEYIRDRISEELGIFDETIAAGIDILPISFKIIDHQIDCVAREVSQTMRTPQAPVNLPRIFHLAIGDNTEIRKYRDYLLTKLYQMENGNKIWDVISRQIRLMEHGVNSGHHYPTTLDDAIRIYKTKIDHLTQNTQQHS